MRSNNVHELLLATATKRGGAVAFRHIYGGRVREIKYNELARLSYLFAAAFWARGLRSGDRLILCADNAPEWVLACVGAWRLGITVVPVDARSRQADLESIAEKIRPGLFLLGRLQNQTLAQSLDEKRVAVLDELLNAVPDDSHERPYFEFRAIAADSPAVILFTSRTPGEPKGVVLSHANLLSAVRDIGDRFNIDASDRLLSLLPLSNIFELTAGLLAPLTKGATIIYTRLKGADHLSEILDIEKISVMIGVPSIFQNVLKHAKQRLSQFSGPIRRAITLAQTAVALSAIDAVDALKLNRLLLKPVHRRLGGKHIKFWAALGAPVPRDLVERLATLGIPLVTGYGLVETSSVVAASAQSGNAPGSVGKPLRHVEIRIQPAGDDSESSSTGNGPNTDRPQSGEILVRGPSVMHGYIDGDKVSKNGIKEGWLHTGDLGYMDSNGFLYVTGRKRETIITAGGYNIHPEELEKILESSPAIKECCVLGRFGRCGEQPHALIVPTAEYADRLADHKFFASEIAKCLADVAEYKRLAGFELHSGALPKSKGRKLKRPECRALYDSLRKESEQLRPSSYDWDADGQLVCDTICAVLDPGTDVREPSQLKPNQVLSGDLGLDSFSRLELAVRLEESFGCLITDDAINDAQTVEDVVALVKSQKTDTVESIENQMLALEREHNYQYDVITDRYRHLDTPGFNLYELMSRAIKPWPFAARPSVLIKYTESPFVDAARRSLAVAVKAALRFYTHFEVDGIDRLSIDPPYIVVADCSSLIQMAAMFASFPRNLLPLLHPLAATDRFFVSPFSAFVNSNLLNVQPFDRFGEFEKSLEECEQLLRRNQILLVVPETPVDNTPGVFRTGAARLAASVGCPILPAHIDTSESTSGNPVQLPRRARLRLRYGEPLYPTANASLEDVRQLSTRIEESLNFLSNA